MLLQLAQNSNEVIRPRFTGTRQIIGRDLDHIVKIDCRNPAMIEAILCKYEADRFVDGGRKHKAVVVIDMLADDVYASRRKHRRFRPIAEFPVEKRDGFLGQCSHGFDIVMVPDCNDADVAVTLTGLSRLEVLSTIVAIPPSAFTGFEPMSSPFPELR